MTSIYFYQKITFIFNVKIIEVKIVYVLRRFYSLNENQKNKNKKKNKKNFTVYSFTIFICTCPVHDSFLFEEVHQNTCINSIIKFIAFVRKKIQYYKKNNKNSTTNLVKQFDVC